MASYPKAHVDKGKKMKRGKKFKKPPSDIRKQAGMNYADVIKKAAKKKGMMA